MRFRFYVLIGAVFSAVSLVPLRARIWTAVVLGAWLGVDLVLLELRQRRARRKVAADPLGEQPDTWSDCDAVYFAPFGADPGRGGMRGECYERKGHDGPHKSTVSVEWPEW